MEKKFRQSPHTHSRRYITFSLPTRFEPRARFLQHKGLLPLPSLYVLGVTSDREFCMECALDAEKFAEFKREFRSQF